MNIYRKPGITARIGALSPRNRYKFAPYCIEIFKHQGRDMKPSETDFISCVQRTPLDGLALILFKHQDNEALLDLFRIAMKFHLYKDGLEPYLENNKKDPKVKKALQVWKSISKK